MITFTRSKVLTAAQVNALDGTDINIVPAPPAGYQIRPISMTCTKSSGTAVGSCANDPIGLCYTGETTVLMGLDAVGAATNSNLLLATGTAAASYLTAVGTLFGTAVAGADATAKGLDVTGQGAAIANFDGTLQVTVTCQLYKVGQID
jgi:hypothetical protein